MFRLLNKSAIWHLCQCVNHWLRNSSKWLFTGTVLQSASRCNTRVYTPGVTPARDGRPRVRGRLVSRVGQSVVSNFSRAIQVPRFTSATRIPSSGQR